MARWIFPLLSAGLGVALLHLALRAHAKWQVLLADGDFSGAESYEIEFWPEFYGGLMLVVLGAFLAGRRFFRRK